MKVLVIGNGGREHALAWKIGQSSRVDHVFVAPGNAGTAVDAENLDIDPMDFPGLIRFAKRNDVGLTVVGPELPLCGGLVDAFQDEGLRVFGPNKQAAELEGSKVFCKNILHGGNVPTAEFQVFREAETAERYIMDRYPSETEDVPVVIKADGLAAGKTILTLPPAQDHKPALDGDQGPNTGGMGAYCPTPMVSNDMMHFVEENVLVPTVHSLKRNKIPFCGVLYAGLMLSNQGPKVLEYNVRFGDPECQPLLMRLQSDLVDLLDAAIDGKLDSIEMPKWDTRPSVCVVMASEGYPGSYEKGREIRGIEEANQLEDVKVFHAGTRLDDDRVLTDGGRVLGVTAMGNSISAAKLQAYKAVQMIRWSGAWCRKDISDKALAHVE